ncbi:MAG TPA: hypothetical protein PKC24_12075, partial [Cyclobacteriaceae bacterium]|nr:hypothetical protein [Cyclobacteriaceae bacterium]
MFRLIMLRILSLLFLALFGSQVLAQELILQNNAPRYKWNQINTPNFRIIYQPDFEPEARRMAARLDQIHHPLAASLGVKPKKIPIILQNRSAISNGFVALAPRRSEFYTMPSQDYNFMGTNDWLELLAVHEYRHVVQFQRSLTGFNKLFYYLFGQQTQAGFSFAAVPLWFWEGDAVSIETAHTPSGRGRIPNFDLMLRTNFLEGRSFNYHKAYLRSFKHFIPDHYVLGYHMVSHVRNQSDDPFIWEKITSDAFAVPFMPFTFSRAIKRHTGMNVQQTYRSMVSDLKSQWSAQLDEISFNEFETMHPRKNKAYTNYNFPHAFGEGAVLVMKEGIGDIETLMLLREGKEEKLFVPGFINKAGMLSYNAGKLVWSEYNFHPRWRMQTYSVIRVYDVYNKQYEKITFKSRLTAPAIAADGERIIAVEHDEKYQTSLVLLNTSGETVRRFENPDNYFYSMPRWSNDGDEVVVLKTKDEGRSIVLLNVNTGQERELIPFTHENIGHPVKHDDIIFYNSPYSGIDNIYALDIKSGKKYQVTSSKYGSYNPSIDKEGNYIYYNEQTRNGLDAVRIPFDRSSWKEIETVIQNCIAYYAKTVEQEAGVGIFGISKPRASYETERYNRSKGLINPHSWGYYFSNDIYQVNLGIFSQDILSTTNIKGGYVYDVNEQNGRWSVDLSYQALFPIIDVSFSAGKRNDNAFMSDNDIRFEWKEQTVEAGLRVPFQLTQSKYITQLNIGNTVGFTQVSDFNRTVTNADGIVIDEGPGRFGVFGDSLLFLYKGLQHRGNLPTNRFSLTFVNALKRSSRDFISPWSQTMVFEHISTPYGGDFEGKLWAFRASLAFPGLFKHHVLFGRLAHQNRLQGPETNLYTFRNRIPRPRGHAYPTDGTFTTLSANYALPLWYPDISIGPLLNIQRVKTTLFYDYGQGSGRNFFYKVD